MHTGNTTRFWTPRKLALGGKTLRSVSGLASVAALLVCAGRTPAQKMAYPIDQYVLPNGLRVILSEDHSVPTVAIVVAYDVGSRNEVKGRSGFAHLFEHMMFQGSEHVAKAQHSAIVEANGGLLNGFTREESTTYYETLPAEKLPVGLWLEADRMRSLAVTAVNLKNQQEVVKEEKRLSLDNQPYVTARYSRLPELAYGTWANQHPTIGSMEDLDAATLGDVQTFFKTYYAPNNALLIVAGDFNPSQARKLILDYFKEIPRQPQPPKVEVTEKPQTAEKREVYNDPLARLPGVSMAWHGPSLDHPDHFALDLLTEILFEGESSRAYQNLVKGSQTALSVTGGLAAHRGASLYTLFALHKPNVPSAEVEKAVYAQIDALKEKPPTSAEMERVKNRLRANRYRAAPFGTGTSLETALGRAIALADYTLFQGDPRLINTEIDRYMSVTPEQVQAAARKYFTPENRTVIEIRPGAAAPRPTSGGQAR